MKLIAYVLALYKIALGRDIKIISIVFELIIKDCLT
jgi:hypothetical protein